MNALLVPFAAVMAIASASGPAPSPKSSSAVAGPPIVENFHEPTDGWATFQVRLAGPPQKSYSLQLKPVSGEGPMIPGEIVRSGALIEGRIACNQPGQDGFYRLTLSCNDQVPQELGTVHLRHSGQFIQFIPRTSANHAYPPEVSRWTDADKARQIDLAKAMVDDVRNQLEAGKKEIHIPHGIYRITKALTEETPGQDTLFLLKGAHSVTIEGNGADFWIADPCIRLFEIVQCEDVLVRNFTVDYDPLAYIQGKVTAVETGKESSLSFKIDPGFESALENYLAHPAGKGMGRIHIFKDDAEHGFPLNPDWVSGTDDGRSNPAKAKAKRHYDPETGIVTVNLTVAGLSRTRPQYGIQIGDMVALTPRYNGVAPLSAEESRHIRFEDIILYAGAKQGIFLQDANFCEMTNVKLKRRPNTRRMVSSNMDGFMMRYIEAGPEIRHCEIEACMDDAIALPFFNSFVYQQVSPREIIIFTRNAHTQINVKQGSRIQIRDPERFLPCGEAVVTSVTRLNGSDIPKQNSLPKMGNPVFKKGGYYRVEVDKPLDAVPSNSYVFSNLWGNRFLVDDCYVRSLWAHGVRTTGSGGIVRRSTFEETRGILFAIEHDWGTGTPIEGITIENNRLLNTAAIRGFTAPILISVLPRKETFSRNSVHEDVVIDGNVIDNAPYAGVMITDASNVQLTGNTFRKTNMLDQPKSEAVSPSLLLDAAIVLEGVENLEMSGNRILERGPGSNAEIKRTPK